jgi:hypothetical protein
MRWCERMSTLIGVFVCAIQLSVGASGEPVSSNNVVERVNIVLADFAAGNIPENVADEALKALIDL